MENIVKYSLVKEKTALPAVKVKSSRDAYEFLSSMWESMDIYESMYMVVLNRGNVIEGYVQLSHGGLAGTFFDVKLMANYALQAHASGVILAHNHPSLQLNPSEADIKITKRAVEALGFLDIMVLDHLILTADGYHSMNDNGDF